MLRERLLVLPLISVTCCPSGPSLLDVLDTHEAESNLQFWDCGGDYALKDCAPAPGEGSVSSEFVTTSQCILEKWSLCEPAKAKLHWTNLPSGESHADRYLYVIPGDKCRLVMFESTVSDRVVRFECENLTEMGECGVLEPTECKLVSTTEVVNPTCH